jgi:stage V sporulation protein R
MQALVIAHAAYGHNSFFKGNHLFKQWTSADAIVDYLVFAKQYLAQCEERHGVTKVERMLDACHALLNLGVDRYKRSPPLSLAKESLRQRERTDYLQAQVNDLWRTLPPHKEVSAHGAEQETRFPSPSRRKTCSISSKKTPRLLEPWQREVVRIVRKIGQYFYPQRQTQVMNEGWATFWHYTLLNTCTTKVPCQTASCWSFCSPTPTWCTSRPTTAHTTPASTPMPWVLPCGVTSNASAKTRRRRPRMVSRHCRLQLA